VAVYTIDKIWKCLSCGCKPVMNILNYESQWNDVERSQVCI
jgi:hypothetical protein